jgi:hypothetical protein
MLRRMNAESRTYRIVSLIGQGGFGKVYRARLETRSGFAREVAIKLLHDASPAAGVLERFRDEARLLGLVRDRALVSVEPPIQLRGRWAVIMEYVEGASLAALLRRHPTGLPVDVALEVVGEVARALDKLATATGPDGRPLCLLHRDLKPGNLQLTPHGEVKLLDFGIARADFDGREAHSTSLMGTPGYVAPERLLGRDGPAGDVYSLGIVLEQLLTGWLPQREPRRPLGEGSPGAAALELARQMAATEPEDRPTAALVVQRASALAVGARATGLLAWARAEVPLAMTPGVPDEGLSGQVLAETSPRVATLDSRIGVLAAVSGGLLGAGGVATLVVGVGVAAVVGLGFALRPSPPPTPGPAPTVAVAPVEPAPIEPEPPPAPAEPDPVARPVVVTPAPAPPIAPGPAPAPPPPTRTVAVGADLAAVSGRVEVLLDGVVVGTVPRPSLAVTDGAHELTLREVATGRSSTLHIVVGPGQPTRYRWAGGDAWEKSQ